MTVSLTHAFVSPKSDGTDNTLVQPSNWNAQHTLSMAAGNLLGRATGAGAGAVTEIPIGVDAAGHVTLPAGSATAAPLNLTAGTNLATATAGAVEYDGTTLYFTPQGVNRGVIGTESLIALTGSNALSGLNTTSPQNVFGGLVAGFTLAPGTYKFRAAYYAYKSAGTNWVYNTLFGGSATIASINYLVTRYYNTSGFSTVNIAPAAMALISTASAATTMATSSQATAYMIMVLEGFVQISAAGTFWPQYSITGSSISNVNHQAPTYFAITPISSSYNTNLVVGAA
jgi:hypothetical protein